MKRFRSSRYRSGRRIRRRRGRRLRGYRVSRGGIRLWDVVLLVVCFVGLCVNICHVVLVVLLFVVIVNVC